ncbi:hypothetical protein BDQ94DRAFT_148551 [Aspergillus welwitschiae]|uniref:Secreted protein n=1 Tax=Aspergillus welwitschiae TaxID=1341132 RepID=A0A3F3PUA8_9EURO|nr:hypothetical protein BDQ94DRAFT_148551 [Aspergillus welwitschiae]RDH30493.1 hypothetical protein BDQ94DRAFT_148551 [Aspergillus welwitschiae]
MHRYLLVVVLTIGADCCPVVLRGGKKLTGNRKHRGNIRSTMQISNTPVGLPKNTRAQISTNKVMQN